MIGFVFAEVIASVPGSLWRAGSGGKSGWRFLEGHDGGRWQASSAGTEKGAVQRARHGHQN